LDRLRAQVKANQSDIADLRREYAVQLRRCSELQQEIDELKKRLQPIDPLSGRITAMQAQLDQLSASRAR
jgi:septal ring factor EnvC (AmiA/AmiB activator)